MSAPGKCTRKRVAFCVVPSTLVIAAVVVVIVLLTRPPDDIETEEQTESIATTAGELSVLRTADLADTGVAEGTLSVLRVTDDNSSYVALNDFVVTDVDCIDLEVRLQAAGLTSASSQDDGVAVVPLTTSDAADFTELLESDFDVDLYEQAALWCADSGVDSLLGDTVDLTNTTLLEGSGSTVLREATLSGTSAYTVEGRVQIIGSGSIVDDALVTNYSLRFEDIEVSSGPDVFLYLTTDPEDPNDVDAEGSLRVELDDSERGTFSFTGTFTQETVPGFVSPEEYVAAVVWCDQFSVFFGSGLFEDV